MLIVVLSIDDMTMELMDITDSQNKKILNTCPIDKVKENFVLTSLRATNFQNLARKNGGLLVNLFW